ncbi:unnamed protein product [Parnassius mnemosyne]|uniref:FP protein C-terminal domain-containing protein n=1 Tax=Parnassius mnemosyne TaxID=213953 RepID=A0AAV1LNR7_9NEOP
MNCNACNQHLQADSCLHYRLCKHDYHYKCLNISSSQFAALPEDFLSSWACPACTNITKRKNRVTCNTPVRLNQVPTADDAMNMSFDQDTIGANKSDCAYDLKNPTTTSRGASQSTAEPITIEKISQLIDDKLNSFLSYYLNNLRSSLKTDIDNMIRDRIDGLKQEFTATTDFLHNEQLDIKKQIEDQNSVVKSLEEENCALKQEISKMNTKLSSMDNMTRSLNLEIHAVPENKNENLLVLFRKLCEVVGANIEESSIRACRRVSKMDPKSSRPRNILVTLASSRQRDLVISAVTRYNKSHSDAMLNSRHLEVPGTSNRIYVAEHLSPEMKMLYAETRRCAADNNYKYTWVRYGKIYTRQDDSSSAILIKNSNCLIKLTKPPRK